MCSVVLVAEEPGFAPVAALPAVVEIAETHRAVVVEGALAGVGGFFYGCYEVAGVGEFKSSLFGNTATSVCGLNMVYLSFFDLRY